MNEHSKEFEAVVQPERAIGVSLSVQTSEDTSIVFQTHFGRDSERSDIREVLDLLNGEAQRLKFKTILPMLEDKLGGMLRSRDRAVEGQPAMEVNAQARLVAAREHVTKELEKFDFKLQMELDSSERRNPQTSKLKSQERDRLKEMLQDDFNKVANSVAEDRKAYDRQIISWAVEIEKLEKQIAEAEKVIGK